MSSHLTFVVQPVNEKWHLCLKYFIKSYNLGDSFTCYSKVEGIEEQNMIGRRVCREEHNFFLILLTSYAMVELQIFVLKFDRFANKLKGSNWNPQEKPTYFAFNLP